MKKQTLKYAFGISFILSLVIIAFMWFAPLGLSQIGDNIVIITDDKSFARDILPAVKTENTNAFFIGWEDFVSNGVKASSLIIDGKSNIDLKKDLKNFDGNIVIINPSDEFSIDGNVGNKMLIAGEASGPLKADENAVKIFNSLTSSVIEPNGRAVHTQKGSISLCITPSPVIMSGSLSSETILQTASFLNADDNSFSHILPGARLLLSLICIISLLSLAWLCSMQVSPAMEFPDGIVAASVKSNGLFFLSRLLLIIVSILVSIAVLFVLGFFNALHKGGILFLSYIIGCSFTTRIFYHFGMLGIKGKPIDIKIPFTAKGLMKSLFFTSVVVAGGLGLYLSGFWKLEFSAQRLFMTGIVFAFLTFGFISVVQDLALLQKAVKGQGIAAALLLFPYIPLFLIAAIYIPLGEFYMTISVLKLIVFTSICLLLSKIVRDRTGSVMYSSMAGSFCLSLFICCQLYI